MRYLLEHPRFSELVKEGWRPPTIDRLDLKALPEGTLGRCYTDQLISQGITPETLIVPSPVGTDTDCITHRLKETHDIIQVLTGCGIDGDSKFGLQGFNLAQTRSPLP